MTMASSPRSRPREKIENRSHGDQNQNFARSPRVIRSPCRSVRSLALAFCNSRELCRLQLRPVRATVTNEEVRTGIELIHLDSIQFACPRDGWISSGTRRRRGEAIGILCVNLDV